MKRIYLIPAGLVIILFFAFTPMKAQDTLVPDTIYVLHLDSLNIDLNEVVITGTRSSKRIIDIPYSVVRLNNLSYRYDRIIGMDDAMPAIPGIFLQSRYGNHDVRISIRGFGSRSNSGIRGVRILLDDIPESEPDGQTRIEAIDFNSVGRIEIVKGNSSSLYTNAPGGVVNFINDVDFIRTHVMQFNQFGSFGLRRNGFKSAVRESNYRLLTTYSYQNYDGYREHNSENWHILNMVLETTPTRYSSLKVLGYFVDGQIRLPGALTREQFMTDPWQADQRAIDRDQKRLSTKGRLGIRYNTSFGQKKNNIIELTGFGTLKYFERTNREYRIINRYGLGLTGRWVNTVKMGERTNEFSVGGDLLFQPARTEYYKNLSGIKDDQLLALMAEKISNTGFYVSENFEVLPNRLSVLLTGRYDRVVYDVRNEIAQFMTGFRQFNAFTPKLALNYKIKPFLSVYASGGLSFDSPAKNEMESLDPGTLYNMVLKAQESVNFEVGTKGNFAWTSAGPVRSILYEVTLFQVRVSNEIVPFEVLGDVFFRNAASTLRRGIEAGAQAELFDHLKVSAAYTFSDFQYQSYEAKTVMIDTTGNIIESTADFSGNAVPSVPRHNLYLSTSYAYPVHQSVSAFVRLSYRGVSGLWVDDANSDKTEGYHLVNSVLGLDLNFGKLNLMISGGLNNLLDEVYVGFTNTNSADGRFYEAGAPRNWFAIVNLGYTF